MRVGWLLALACVHVAGGISGAGHAPSPPRRNLCPEDHGGCHLVGSASGIIHAHAMGPRRGLCLGLRGGKKLQLSKEDKRDMKLAAGAQLDPELEKDLRRHWKRKPKEIWVMSGGVKKKIRTKAMLQVMRDRAKEAQAALKLIPMRLLNLGMKGVKWVRDIPGMIWDRPSKWELLEQPPRELSKDEARALEIMDKMFAKEDGYAIARSVKPHMAQKLPQLMPADAAAGKERAMSAIVGKSDGGEDIEMTVAETSEVGKVLTPKELRFHGQLVIGDQPAEKMPHIGSHTYGEVGARGFAEVLHLAAPKKGEVFVDLGSGTGKAVLLAAALYPFKRAYGIEFVPELHEAATRLLSEFNKRVVSKLPLYSRKSKQPVPEIDFTHEDLTKCDWSSANIAFAACTCWSDKLMKELEKGCEKMAVGSRVITMTRKLAVSEKTWNVTKTRQMYGKGKFTWWIYERIA